MPLKRGSRAKGKVLDQTEPAQKRSKPGHRVKSGGTYLGTESTQDESPLDLEGVSCDPLWIDKYSPKTSSELTVNDKKIAQVRDWLSDIGNPRSGMRLTNVHQKKVLFLTGPCGSCKSTTVEVLAKDLNIEIIRWMNLSMVDGYGISRFLEREEIKSFSLEFKEFMRESSRSSTPPLDSLPKVSVEGTRYGKKFILIEDLPNMNIPDIRETVQRELHMYIASKRSIVPVVIILTDPSPESTYARYYNVKGFIKNYHEESIQSLIKTLAFLPVSQQLIKKSLKRVISLRFKPKEENELRERASMYIENIVESSVGDLRHAINTLQFYVLSDSPKIPHKTSIMTKDMSKTIYSSAGNILYNKFSNPSKGTKLVPEMNNILENICVDPYTFVLFLHQNYLEFFTDIDDARNASESFSYADLLPRRMYYTKDLHSYYLSIPSRAITTHNKRPAPNTYKKLLFSDFWKVSAKERALKEYLSTLARCVGTTLDIKCFHDALRKRAVVMDILPFSRNILRDPELSSLDANPQYASPDIANSPYVPYPTLSQYVIKRRESSELSEIMSHYTNDDIEEW